MCCQSLHCLLSPELSSEMTATLDSLHRAVIASPLDHTIRLIYADALDETGEPVHVARAAFIRAQIEMKAAAHDVFRLGQLMYRCSELFEAHWLAWWTPIAAAAGLPAPHVPRKRVRDRISRAVRRPRRPANSPYTITTGDTTVHLVEYGLSFRFAGGFPEEVRFLHFDAPEDAPGLVHRWGAAIPLVRLSLSPALSTTEWESVDGPHLSRLTDLSFESLLEGVIRRIAASAHLTGLSRLAVNPIGADIDAIRVLVASPPWANLRALQFTGRLGPEGVIAVARASTLDHLEELELVIGNPGLLGNPTLEAASAILRMVIRAVAFPSAEAAPRWADFGPALEALAGAEWVKTLRTLRILFSHPGGIFTALSERLHGGAEAPADTIPDLAVLALASALSPDKLERLVLPAALINPSVREELTTRMGGRVEFR
jgi:uncharacterized protein (TIGR02996 family)